MKSRTPDELHRDYGMTVLTEIPSAFLPFATTSEFSSLARNHCYAIMVMNLLLQEYPEYCRRFTRRDLFLRIHAAVGNGPVFTLRRANSFLQKEGLPGRFERVPLSAQHPHSPYASKAPQPFRSALLLAAGPFDWHWVLASADASRQIAKTHTGRTPSPCSGSTFRVITGWDSRQLFQWNPCSGVRLLSIWQFHPGTPTRSL